MKAYKQVDLGKDIHDQLYNTVWKRIDIPLLTRLNNQLNNQLDNQLSNQLYNHQLYNQLYNQLNIQLYIQLDNENKLAKL
jgi:hypothetical protein